MIFVPLLILGAAALTLVGKAMAHFLRHTDVRDLLEENEPTGLHKRSWLLWQLFKWSWLPVFWFFRKLHTLTGKANVEKAVVLKDQGYAMILVMNHRSSADVWMPQLILYFNGLKSLAEKAFFYVIGLKFFNRHWFFSIAIRCVDRIPIVPDTMLPTNPSEARKLGRALSSQLRIARDVNSTAVAEAKRLMESRRWMFVFPEGTRQRSGVMGEPNENAFRLFDYENLKTAFLPAGLSGTREMWPPLSSVFRFRINRRVGLHVGEPITMEELKAEAAVKASQYGISLNRAALNCLMYRIAATLQANGHADICGVFNIPWEERDWGKKTAKKAEMVGVGGSTS